VAALSKSYRGARAVIEVSVSYSVFFSFLSLPNTVPVSLCSTYYIQQLLLLCLCMFCEQPVVMLTAREEQERNKHHDCSEHG
jgi:hypothetical protein